MSLLYEPVTDFNEEEHIYKVEGIEVPSVTTILQEAGFRKNMAFFTQAGSNRGTYIHKLTEQLDEGCMDWGQVGEYLPYIDAYIQFKEDYGLEILLREGKMFNRAMWYAGTVDIIGHVKGDEIPAVIDIKTGQPDKATDLQLILYGGMVKWQTPAEELPLRTACLYLKKTGKYKYVPTIDRDDYKAAAFGAVHCHHFRSQM